MKPERWVASYADYLYSLAVMKTGDREAAQDLVQEVFLSAIRASDSFKGLSSEKTWLTAILNNKVIDFYRKKDVLKDAGDYLASTDTSFHTSFFEPESERHGHWRRDVAPKEWEEGPDTTMERKEFYEVLQHCISQMPLKLVPAFVAKYIEDQDSDKICKDLNLSPSNYWVMLHRAKLLVRSCLEKNWFVK